ncbi:hypothetical protein DFP74_3385 [Nocardiopsis sp. Huas11]|uniref:membrane fusogenic activity family protein n=1 Tax=Nocardiopsis sp. Huas11 TaxID=2183912 RepID=UPI000EB5C9ED|nr:membrane fusogenic activity family protein [Nocardiopsis sp. Huas11]RKS07702.1 hypothetical protein DFP74_3385 [Nocardiopsis sp. Huas11]
MVVDAVRTYFDATSGLTELSRKEAVAAAKALLKANGRPAAPAVEQEALPARVGQSIQALAGELIATNEANRTAIAELVGSEVARQLERMDIVPRAEYERVVRRVAELERRLAARHMVDRVPVSEVALVAASGGAVVGGGSVAGPGAAVRSAAPEEAEEAEEPVAGAAGARTAAGAAEEEATADAVSGAESEDEPEAGSEPEAGERARTGAGADDAEDAEDAAGTESGGAAPARKTTSRSKPRTTTKSARARSAPKRTTKAKGSTGKGSTKK